MEQRDVETYVEWARELERSTRQLVALARRLAAMSQQMADWIREEKERLEREARGT